MRLARRRRVARTFGMPAVLGVLSAVGLLLALVADEIWDFAASIALATPMAVIGWKVARAGWNGPQRRGCLSSE